MKISLGVRETRSVDYDKGTAELIVNAEIAKNPQKLCNWILKETRKHAYVDNTYNTSYLVINYIISIFLFIIYEATK